MDDLTAGEWQRVKAIVGAVLEREASDASFDRSAWIDEACANEPRLKTAVEALVASDRDAGSFLDRPAASLLRASDAAARARDVDESAHSGSDTVRTFSRFDRPNIGRADGGLVEASDIRDVLHSRLRAAAVIAFGALSVFNVMRLFRLDMTSATVVHYFVPAALYLGVLAVTAAVLWSRRAWTLSQLRVAEIVVFGAMTIYFLNETINPLFGRDGWLIPYAQRHPSEMSILARQVSILWLTLIVVYGTFVPNTGRRCAIVTGVMAVSPILVVAIGGALEPTLPPRLLLLFLQEVVMWMAIAVAIAIYGSHKITTLRQEALAARKIGQYRLKERLGRGGMGEVYLAEHMLLRRPCAVKIIRPEHAGDARALERFMREVQVTATLSHPNTVQVFDYGRASDGTVFYAMEFLSGLNLDELVRRHGPLPRGRAVHVLRQVCGALSEAHAIGLIHRDIKPSNIILSTRGGVHDVAKLVDFGLARIQAMEVARAGLTEAGSIFGTPAFMSPEQAAGQTSLDARSDIYSLGAVGYFLLCGEPPFVRPSVVQTLAAHLHDVPGSIRGVAPDVDADVEAVVRRCLEKDPSARFQTAIALEHALAGCRSSVEWAPADASAWWSQAAHQCTT